ncbi:MAG: hypothetical protein AAF488_15900 [Planctomycetota bacterium]
MSDSAAGGRKPNDRDELPLRQVLSRDEIRELLSPLRTDSAEERAPVLLVTDRPEDGEDVARCLTRRGVSLVPASHRFAALDWFRQRRYAAVVAGTRSLGVEAQGFVERLREVDASIPIFLICQADEEPAVDPDTPGVEFVERPLSEEQLASLLRCLGFEPGDAENVGETNQPRERITPGSDRTDSAPGREPSFRPESIEAERRREPLRGPEGDPAETAAARAPIREEPRISERVRASEAASGFVETRREEREPQSQPPSQASVTSRAPSSLPGPGEPHFEAQPPAEAREARWSDDSAAPEWVLPDPLAAVRSILEARLAGGHLEAGLRRWIHEDERVAGMAILERETPAQLESPGTAGLGSAGYGCRAISTTAPLREEILRAVGSHLAETVFEDDRPIRVEGPFYVFSEPVTEVGTGAKRWAVYVPRIAEAPGPAQELAERLVEVMSTLRRVPAEHREGAGEGVRAGRPASTSVVNSDSKSAPDAASGLTPREESSPRPDAWFAASERTDSEPELTRVRARLDALERWLTAER